MLLDDLKGLSEQAAVKQCIVGKWLLAQEPEVSQVLEELSVKPGFSPTGTYDVIRKNDPSVPFKRTAFGDHIRKVCACQAI